MWELGAGGSSASVSQCGELLPLTTGLDPSTPCTAPSIAMRVPPALPVRVMTQNVRYDKPAPLFPGESEWAVRCPRQVAAYRFHVAHAPAAVICLQEVLQNQLRDILVGLNAAGTGPAPDEWTFVGVGRDECDAGNEYNPILYQHSVWQLHRWWTRWLSPTPEVPGSKWPGIGLARIVTIAHLQHRAAGHELLVMCTHLDHTSATARHGQAQLLAHFAQHFSRAAGAGRELPVVLAGDFNSEPTEAAYQYIVNQTPFVDAWLHVPAHGYRYGHRDTFTDFIPTAPTTRIDFIFLRRTPDSEESAPALEDSQPAAGLDRWSIEGAAVLANVFEDGIYLSDHRAVVVDALLSP